MAMHPKGQTGPPFAGLLLTCLFSCATGGPAARPSEVGGAPSPPRTAQLDGAPSEEPRSAKEAGGATPPQPAPHIIALPLEADELGAPPPLASVAPGEPPSPAYPAGTAYIARSQRDGNFVTEWDLARGSPRRRVGLHPAMQNLRIRRAGGALHVVGWAVEDGAMWYERLGLELAPGHAEFVAWADNEGLGALACDAQLAVVIVTGQIGPPEPRHDSAPLGIVGASFDEKGRTVVRRILRPDSSRDDEDGCHYRSNAVVIRGEVHLVVATQGCGPNKIITLDRQLEVQRQAVANELALEGEQPLSVSALSWGDRFFVQAEHLAKTQPASTRDETTEISASGAPIGQRASCPRDPYLYGHTLLDGGLDAWVGGEHVRVYTDRLEWTDAALADAPPPPCPGATGAGAP